MLREKIYCIRDARGAMYTAPEVNGPDVEWGRLGSSKKKRFGAKPPSLRVSWDVGTSPTEITIVVPYNQPNDSAARTTG